MNNAVKFIFSLSAHGNKLKSTDKVKSKGYFSENIVKEHNIVAIIAYSMIIFTTFNAFFGNIAIYSYLSDIGAVDLIFSANERLSFYILPIMIIISAMLIIYLFLPYYLFIKKNINFTTLKEKNQRLIVFFKYFSILLFIQVITGFLIYKFIEYHNKHYEFFSADENNYIIGIVLIIILVFPTLACYLMLAVINNKKVFLNIEYILSLVFYSTLMPFIIFLSFLYDLQEIPRKVFYFFFIPSAIIFTANLMLVFLKEKLNVVFIIFTFIIFIIILFFNTNVVFSVLNAYDKQPKSYLISMEIDIPPQQFNNKDIYCGRILWRQGDTYIFLPYQNENNKENYRIGKEYIELYQGHERDTICNTKSLRKG